MKKRLLFSLMLFLAVGLTACGGGSGGGGGTAPANTSGDDLQQTLATGMQRYQSEIASGKATDEALNSTVAWYSQQDGVYSAYISGSGKNIFVKDSDGNTRLVVTNAALIPSEGTSAVATLPKALSSVTSSATSLRVLILDPFNLPYTNVQRVKTVFSQLQGAQVDVLSGESVTPLTFENLSSYNAIYIFDHGDGSERDKRVWLATREKYTKTKGDAYKSKFDNTGVNYKDAMGTITVDGTPYFSISDVYIKLFSKNLKATAVYVDGCFSLASDGMGKAFIDNGAKAYFGWGWYTSAESLTGIIGALTGEMAESFFSTLTQCNTVQEAYSDIPFYLNFSRLRAYYGDMSAKLPTCTIGNQSPEIGEDRQSIEVGTTLQQWGSNFSPNTAATLHFQKPDGTEYPTTSQPIDSSGRFSISYPIPSTKPSGKYLWWAIDGATSQKSNVLSYYVTANTSSSPQIGQNQLSGSPGTIFSQWGSGFSPGTKATLHFRKPDGTEYPTATQSINSSGVFSISYTVPASKPSGTYTWWAVDGKNGRSSNTVSYDVTNLASITPSISQTPGSGVPGVVFTQSGTGFSPGGTATLHFKKPDGSEYPTASQTIDSSGNFSISYPTTTSKAPGTYTWWAIDGPTGKSSNTLTYTINVSPTIAQSPMSANPGDTFSQWGTGFSANSTAVLHFQKPDGSEYPTSNQGIDANGTFSIPYTAPTSKAPGTYKWWAIDGPTGKASNTVSYKINVAPVIAQTPMSGAAGTTFAQWGTGFSANSTATLHFRKPDGSEYPTSSQSIDQNGTFSISYPSPTNKPNGSYTWWAIDGPTGKKSNEVTYKIK